MIVKAYSADRDTMIAREIITQVLFEASLMASSLAPGHVIVIAPIIPGGYYPDIDYQWVDAHLHKSTATVDWQEYYSYMTYVDTRSRVTVARPGLSHWIGSVTFDVAAELWPQWDLATIELDGAPVIIHRTDATTMTIGEAVPILADFTP